MITNILKPVQAMILTATLLTTPHLLAQDRGNNDRNTTDVNAERRFWQASLPGGNYMVALDRISSASIHSYVVKGAIVHEVNIVAQGAGLVRFYSIEAVGEDSEANIAKNLLARAKDLADEAGRRSGNDASAIVTKEYPITTHAKTIEYRLFDKSDLNKLYNSLTRAWKENKGRKFSIK